jgi:hypothetical protein
VHEAARAAFWALPARQTLHVELPAAEYFPGPQSWHAAIDAPSVFGFTVPAGHRVHSLSAYQPAEQGEHEELPIGAPWPVAQLTQAELDELPSFGFAVPAGHWLQPFWPELGWTEPAGHFGHILYVDFSGWRSTVQVFPLTDADPGRHSYLLYPPHAFPDGQSPHVMPFGAYLPQPQRLTGEHKLQMLVG